MAADALTTIAVSSHSHGAKSTLIEAAETEFVIGKEASPLEYLLGSLAACINVIGHLVAKDQGFVIHDLDVSVSGEIDPAKYKGEATATRAGFQSFSVEVAVDADADQAALESWLDAVAERCPVADNLTNASDLAVSVSPMTAADGVAP